jgi:hypothetical protein
VTETETKETEVSVEAGIRLTAVILGSVKFSSHKGGLVVEFTLCILDGKAEGHPFDIRVGPPSPAARRDLKQLQLWTEAVGAHGNTINEIIEDAVVKTVRLGGVYWRLGYRSEGPNGAERLVIGKFRGVDAEGDME